MSKSRGSSKKAAGKHNIRTEWKRCIAMLLGIIFLVLWFAPGDSTESAGTLLNGEKDAIAASVSRLNISGAANEEIHKVEELVNVNAVPPVSETLVKSAAANGLPQSVSETAVNDEAGGLKKKVDAIKDLLSGMIERYEPTDKEKQKIQVNVAKHGDGVVDEYSNVKKQVEDLLKQVQEELQNEKNKATLQKYKNNLDDTAAQSRTEGQPGLAPVENAEKKSLLQVMGIGDERRPTANAHNVVTTAQNKQEQYQQPEGEPKRQSSKTLAVNKPEILQNKELPNQVTSTAKTDSSTNGQPSTVESGNLRAEHYQNPEPLLGVSIRPPDDKLAAFPVGQPALFQAENLSSTHAVSPEENSNKLSVNFRNHSSLPTVPPFGEKTSNLESANRLSAEESSDVGPESSPLGEASGINPPNSGNPVKVPPQKELPADKPPAVNPGMADKVSDVNRENSDNPVEAPSAFRSVDHPREDSNVLDSQKATGVLQRKEPTASELHSQKMLEHPSESLVNGIHETTKAKLPSGKPVQEDDPPALVAAGKGEGDPSGAGKDVNSAPQNTEIPPRQVPPLDTKTEGNRQQTADVKKTVTDKPQASKNEDSADTTPAPLLATGAERPLDPFLNKTRQHLLGNKNLQGHEMASKEPGNGSNMVGADGGEFQMNEDTQDEGNSRASGSDETPTAERNSSRALLSFGVVFVLTLFAGLAVFVDQRRRKRRFDRLNRTLDQHNPMGEPLVQFQLLPKESNASSIREDGSP